MKPVAKNIRKKTVSLALASIFALAPLLPLLAQDNKSQPAQPPAAPSPVQDDDTSLPAADSTPISSPSPEATPINTTPASGNADPLFVSQTQASQKSSPLKADESSGALHYDYPLETPPGRNGLQPDLKLSYNSQNQEEGSVFGYGWTINIPYIQRKNTHGTDKLYSGFDFTSALSGDLVATNAGNSTFISRVDDGGYLKYSLDANQTWTAQSKQGLTYIFGATAGERQDDPTNPGHVYTWLLSSIVDSNGNSVTYTYAKNQGQVYPDTISYSGIYEISFSRTARQDPYHGYRTGFSVTSAYLVSSIQVRIDNSVSKSYVLTYSNNPTTKRSRLQSVAVQDGTHTFPPITFDYQLESAKGFNATWSSTSVPIDLKNGVFPVDINGDSYPDLIKAYEWNYVYYSSDKSVSINHPESNNWQIDSAWQLPPNIMIDTDGAWNRNVDSGTRVVDFNGDLKPDFLRYQNLCFICTTDQEINTGSGWNPTTSWLSPISTNGGTRTTLDLNGDGLTDVFGTNGLSPYGSGGRQFQTSISLNNGSDFINYGHYNSWPPDPSMSFTDAPDFLSDYLSVDINADGLPDLIKSSWYYGYPTSRWEKKIYLNNGHGWAEDAAWTFPDVCYFCQGSAGQSYNTIYFQDFNNDGYTDFVIPGGINVNNQQLSYSNVYINNGHGWTEDTGWYSLAYFYSDNCFCQNPALFFDGNADGSPDIYVSNQSGSGPPSTNIFENKNHNQVDLLSLVTLPSGGTINVTYKTSAQYRGAIGELLNPKLPLIIQTVEKIITDDKNGGIFSTTYSYADGRYYYNGPFDRKFAGFGSITATDAAGNVSKTYLHQGNESNQSLGEDSDEYWKIGKPYRIEQYDNAGHLYSQTVNRWDSYSLGSNSKFVKLAQTVESIYDGNATHKDKAETYTYDDSNGNLTQKISWGEVNGNDDGTFTDVGTDAYTTNTSYASGSSLNIIGLSSQEITVDQNSNKVKETKYYYDMLPLGLVNLGNVTREEDWKSGSAYIHTTKDYNSFGLVTQETDPLDHVTKYAYDAFNLYPATVTNALNQTVQYLYDYAHGKVKQLTDANGHIFQTSYDGLGRILEEKQPNINATAATTGQLVRSRASSMMRRTGATQRKSEDVPTAALVSKATYFYTDIGVGSSIRKTEYLDEVSSVDTYTYFDGLGRAVQTRKRAEASNTFSVIDQLYNNRGLLAQQSSPYFSAAATRTASTTNAVLYTTYTYDPIQRIVTATNAAGSTTNAYDDWKLTIIDANGKSKVLYKDAYDRLTRVDEHNGAETYSTAYAYNGLGNLLSIRDAQNNVRNFTYDGLGRRRTAEDLHDPRDFFFGVWTYTYDDSNNLKTQLDPKGQTISYTYDALNRILDEKADGATQVTYTYDTCDNGVGRLCTIVTDALTQFNTYTPLGILKSENKTIGSNSYLTQYGYNRQGNLTLLTNPDNSQVKYEYNQAGLIERVLLREGGAQQDTSIVDNFDYSPLGNISFEQFGNGAKTTNTYDASKLYRLQHKVTVLPASGGTTMTAQDLTYNYDNVGNITSLVDSSDLSSRETINYEYDDLYRLTSAIDMSSIYGLVFSQQYSYDAIGNILSSSQGEYTYGGNRGNSYANPHAVTDITSTYFQNSYKYDNNGNLISPSKRNSYQWDYYNRLVGAIVGRSTLVYDYDQNGQRIRYSIGKASITDYPNRYYNVATIISGRNVSIKATKHIFAGDELVSTVIGSGTNATIHSIHTDHLSGSNVVFNTNSGVEEYTNYYPFGDIRSEQNNGVFSEQRKFSGHEYDIDSALSYMDARYYDPAIGRFLNQDLAFLAIGDPSHLKSITQQDLAVYLSDPQNINSYSYVRNNPIRYTDPTGQFSFNPLGFLSYNTQVAIGNWANNAYANNAVARYALDHPYQAGAVSGIAGGALVAGGVVAAGGSITCGILCGSTAATIATTTSSTAATQVDRGQRAVSGALQVGDRFGKLGTVIENSPESITGFTRGHGIDQAISNGVSPQVLLETMSNPLAVLQQSGNTRLFLSQQAVVVLNKAGLVVTTYGSNLFKPEVQAILNKALGK
jgi:RHS repeat-associated protein